MGPDAMVVSRAAGARTCLATGLMLPNVCIVDREHGLHDGRALKGVSLVNPLFPFNPRMSGWRKSFGVKQQGNLALQALRVPRAGMHGERTNCTSTEGDGAS